MDSETSSTQIEDSDDSLLDFKELNDAEFDLPSSVLPPPSLESILWDLESRDSADNVSEHSHRSAGHTVAAGGTNSMLYHSILQGITAQVKSAEGKVGAGSATAVANCSAFVSVGTSHGYLLTFDAEQKLCWCCRDSITLDQGAISAIAFNLQSTRVLVGFERGYILQLDAHTGDVVRRLASDADAHAPHSAVLQLRYCAQTAAHPSPLALVGDSSGCIFQIALARRLGVRTTRSRCLFSGARGEVCTFEPLLEMGASVDGGELVVAIATLSKVIVITIKPRLRVLFSQSLPRCSTALPLLAWQLVLVGKTWQHVLCWARGTELNYTRLVRTCNNSSTKAAKLAVVPLRQVQQLPYTLTALHWLGAKHLALLDTSEHLRLIDVRTQRELECIDVTGAGLVYASAHFKALAVGGSVSRAFALAAEHACYNSVASRGDQLLLLGTRHLRLFKLRTWHERLVYLSKRGCWTEALRIAAAEGADSKTTAAGADNLLGRYVDMLQVQSTVDWDALSAAVGCCIKLKKADLLCNQLWDAIAGDRANREWYLALLADYICQGAITRLSPAIAQALISYLDSKYPNTYSHRYNGVVPSEHLSVASEHMSSEHTSVTSKHVPVINYCPSMDSEHLSMSNEHLSSGCASVTTKQVPVINDRPSTISEHLSMSNEHLSMSSEHLSLPTEHIPVANKQIPVINEHVSMISEHLSMPSEHTSMSSKHIPARSKQVSMVNDRPPTISKHLSMSNEHLSISNEHLSMSSEHTQAASKQMSVTNEHMSMISEHLPVTSKYMSMIGGHLSVASEHELAISEHSFAGDSALLLHGNGVTHERVLTVVAEDDHMLRQVLLSLDLTCLDLDQALRICKARRFYDAWIHITTKTIGDYAGPLVEFLGELTPNNHRLGNTLLVYVSASLSGYGHPYGRIPTVDRTRVKYDIVRCLETLHSRNAPDNEPSYPYLRALLAYNIRECLNVIRLAFNGDGKDGELFSGEMGAMERVRMLEICMVVVQPPQFDTSEITALACFISRLITTNQLKLNQIMLDGVIKALTNISGHPLSKRDHNDREQAWMDLLLANKLQHIPRGQLLSGALEAKCYKVAEYLYELSADFDQILRCRLLDSEVNNEHDPSTVFAYIRQHINTHMRCIRTQFQQYLLQLLRLNGKATVEILLEHYLDDLDKFCAIVEQDENCQFVLLRGLVYNYDKVSLELSEKYLELACKRDDADVENFVQMRMCGIDTALVITQRYHKDRATARLLEMNGDYKSALKTLLNLDLASEAQSLCIRATDQLDMATTQSLWLELLQHCRSKDKVTLRDLVHDAAPYIPAEQLLELVAGAQVGDVRALLEGVFQDYHRDIHMLRVTLDILGNDLHHNLARRLYTSTRALSVARLSCDMCRRPFTHHPHTPDTNNTDTSDTTTVTVFGCGHAYHTACCSAISAGNSASTSSSNVSNDSGHGSSCHQSKASTNSLSVSSVCVQCNRRSVPLVEVSGAHVRASAWRQGALGVGGGRRPDLEGHF